MLPDLKLRQVGTRHVASVVRNGQREDVGEVQEAHLRAYAASLPGSYRCPTSETARTANGLSTAFAAQRFADAVEARKRRLLSEDSTLSELEGYRLAASQVSQENPSMVAAHRADVRKI